MCRMRNPDHFFEARSGYTPCLTRKVEGKDLAMPTVGGLSKDALRQLLASLARVPAASFEGVDATLLKAAAANLNSAAGGSAVDVSESAEPVPLSQLVGRQFVEAAIERGPLVVFSKTTCGFCSRLKRVLSEYTDLEPVVQELDKRDDMSTVQVSFQWRSNSCFSVTASRSLC
jgi:hypothetical protein